MALIQVYTGVYTPTLTGVANVAASTAYSCQYVRVGDVVIVSGKLDLDPTAATTLTQLGISLPVTSNIGAEEDCAGSAGSPVILSGAAIRGDAGNNRAEFAWTTGLDVTNQSWFFQFMYQII
jgi:hypothetical protein